MGGQSQAEPLYGALTEKPADPSTAPLEGAQALLPDGKGDLNKKEVSAVKNKSIDNYTTHPLCLEQKINDIDNHSTHPVRLVQKTGLGAGYLDDTLDHALSAVSLQQIKNATGPMPAEGLKKIHALWGHLSAAQLKKSLSHVEGMPAETKRIIERITKECSTCSKFSRAPTLPVGAHEPHCILIIP